jgi:hypothetical protein
MMEKSSSKKGAAATTQAAPGTQQKIKHSTLRIKIITFNKKNFYPFQTYVSDLNLAGRYLFYI